MELEIFKNRFFMLHDSGSMLHEVVHTPFFLVLVRKIVLK